MTSQLQAADKSGWGVGFFLLTAQLAAESVFAPNSYVIIRPLIILMPIFNIIIIHFQISWLYLLAGFLG